MPQGRGGGRWWEVGVAVGWRKEKVGGGCGVVGSVARGAVGGGGSCCEGNARKGVWVDNEEWGCVEERGAGAVGRDGQGGRGSGRGGGIRTGTRVREAGGGYCGNAGRGECMLGCWLVSGRCRVLLTLWLHHFVLRANITVAWFA